MTKLGVIVIARLFLGFAIGEKARPTPYRGVVFCNHPFAGAMSFQSAH